eukprot:PhF_6_TR15409/c0_g1_i2/m.23886
MDFLAIEHDWQSVLRLISDTDKWKNIPPIIHETLACLISVVRHQWHRIQTQELQIKHNRDQVTLLGKSNVEFCEATVQGIAQFREDMAMLQRQVNEMLITQENNNNNKALVVAEPAPPPFSAITFTAVSHTPPQPTTKSVDHYSSSLFVPWNVLYNPQPTMFAAQESGGHTMVIKRGGSYHVQVAVVVDKDSEPNIESMRLYCNDHRVYGGVQSVTSLGRQKTVVQEYVLSLPPRSTLAVEVDQMSLGVPSIGILETFLHVTCRT